MKFKKHDKDEEKEKVIEFDLRVTDENALLSIVNEKGKKTEILRLTNEKELVLRKALDDIGIEKITNHGSRKAFSEPAEDAKDANETTEEKQKELDQ